MTKTAFDRMRVDLWVSGSSDKYGRGGYAALMYSHIQQKSITKTIGGYASDTTITRMTLKAIVEALRCIKNPSIIHIYTSLPQISKGLNQTMYDWEKNDWCRLNGGFLKHVDLWQEILSLLKEKSISYKVHYGETTPRPDYKMMTIHRASEYLRTAQRKLNEVAIS